ncbi:MAG: GAF domain-containing protein [Candidatus Mariimomonas ferrooxydans]
MSKRIRKLNSELTTLKKNRDEMIGTFANLKNTCNLILKEIQSAIKTDNGSIMLLDEETNKLQIIVAFGMHVDQKTELGTGTGIAGDVLKTGKIELINNISADDRFVPGHIKIKTMLCAPLKIKRKILGVINLSYSNENYFNLDDLKLLRVLAIYASIAIENARLFTTAEKLTDSFIRHVSLLDVY